MWVNNSAAMYRYAATSASAVLLPQFSSPPPIANPVGLAAQASVAPANNAAARRPRRFRRRWPPRATLSTTAGFSWPTTGQTNSLPRADFRSTSSVCGRNWRPPRGFSLLGGDVGQGLARVGRILRQRRRNWSAPLGPLDRAAPRAAVGVGVMVGKLMAPPSVVGLLPASQSPVQLARRCPRFLRRHPGCLPSR